MRIALCVEHSIASCASRLISFRRLYRRLLSFYFLFRGILSITRASHTGPHPTAMFEVNTFTPHQTGVLFSWLTVHRGPCSYVA